MRSLVTGFPGFIGRRLVRRLLSDDPDAHVVCLVERRMEQSASECADTIDRERIEIVAGDIGDRHLGLDGDEYRRLAGEIGRVYHLAAVYDLAVPIKVAQRVNVEGTGNVLDFCRDASELERLVYISTAYVAGKRTGYVYEHELVMGQGFKNHYESTKFQAEVWVRQRMGDIPTTILRPAIVVGDSQTGETEKFDGPYYILRSIAQAQRLGRPVMQFGAMDGTFNVVPVDFVVGAIAAAGDDPKALGETLHLVDPEPLSTNDLVATLSREYAGVEPKGKLPPKLVETALRFPTVKKAFNNTPRESIAYLNHPVTFDTRRATEVLTPHDLRPPKFAEYVANLVAYFKEHEGDPAYAPKPS